MHANADGCGLHKARLLSKDAPASLPVECPTRFGKVVRSSWQKASHSV
jgi:hypothetical protein